jgi:hypothetical protein
MPWGEELIIKDPDGNLLPFAGPADVSDRRSFDDIGSTGSRAVFTTRLTEARRFYADVLGLRRC